MQSKINEKIIELFTEPKNIDTKDEDIKKLTKDYMLHLSKNPKWTYDTLKELIVKDKESAINTTQEWFIDTLGFDYIKERENACFKMFGNEMSLNKFINEFPMFLIILMIGISIEKTKWSIEKIRYISNISFAMIFNTSASTISAFLIVINQYFYNKIHNIKQNDDAIYDAIFEVIKKESPRLLDY